MRQENRQALHNNRQLPTVGALANYEVGLRSELGLLGSTALSSRAGDKAMQR